MKMINITNNGINNIIKINKQVQETQKSNILIQGCNNLIEICENVELPSCLIQVKGNNSSIIIEDNCILRGKFRCRE